MKRKLINFDTFKVLENQSLSNAEGELLEASDLIRKALQLEHVDLRCFGSSQVMYETSNGTFIHAVYNLDENYLTLDNIEELVIDEETETKTAKQILSNILENVLEDKELEADSLFKSYITMPRMTNEGRRYKVSKSAPNKRSKLRNRPQNRALVAKRIRNRLRTLRRLSPSQKRVNALLRKKVAKSLPNRNRARVVGRFVNEQNLEQMATISENVLNYVDFKVLGPVLSESSIVHDEQGNVTSIKIPTSKLRNEAKILSFNWKTLDNKVKVLRDKGKSLTEDTNFCKKIALLKRQSAIHDNEALETSLADIVQSYPSVLYLTQDELASKIKESLESTRSTNWDDQTCTFMAEGILRMAFETYPERIDQITHLAKFNKQENSYEEFKTCVEDFFPSVDQILENEDKIFHDLASVLSEIKDMAKQAGNGKIYNECQKWLGYLNNSNDLELAETVASWIQDFVESNLAEEWEYEESPHISVSGDHPVTKSYANKNYAPDKDFSSGPDLYDGEEIAHKSWGNKEGVDDNPYLLKGGEYTMKNDKGVDVDPNPLGSWQGNDTWPNLNNPYLPKAADIWKNKL